MEQPAGGREGPGTVEPVLVRLLGGDLRSTGEANAVAAEILEEVLQDEPESQATGNLLFSDLVGGLLLADPLIRMRAADAIEKITRQAPFLLQPYKNLFLREISAIQQKEVRWHTAVLLPRLELDNREQMCVIDILSGYMEEENQRKKKSSLVCTFTLQGLAEMAMKYCGLKEQIVPLVEEYVQTGTPAMRARGRKLLDRLEKTHLGI